MQYLKDFCHLIDLQDEMIDYVLKYDAEFDDSAVKNSMKKLFSRKTWDEGRAEIKKILGEDPKGVGILTCMLKCGMQTYNRLKADGMPEKILIDTMKCFPRFIEEHMQSYGTYAFDRDFWTARQISGNLFRIEELEYELVEEESPYVSIHIPSDAKISLDFVKKSYQEAKSIFKQFFPEYKDTKMVCDSWLLSPALKEVLPEDSNIILFQNLFRIEKVNYDSTDFMEWIFKKSNIPLDSLPEDTSLQRNLKQYLLKGGKVGEAFGILDESILIE